MMAFEGSLADYFPESGRRIVQRHSLLDCLLRSPMSLGKPIVFIVDDDVYVCESLKLLIESAGWKSQAFGSGREFLSQPRLLEPSCLVLDVNLPDFNGLDLQALVADRTDMPIIFISGYGNVPMTVRAMRAGAVEFLTKPLDSHLLLGAIRDAINRSYTELGSAALMRVLRQSYASLSHREREVLALVVAGRLNKQVGSDLGISEITVKAHRGKMMRKMQARSLPDLVRMAEKLCLSPCPRQGRPEQQSCPGGTGPFTPHFQANMKQAAGLA
jgi:FixJ family two-component response regulator